MNKYFCLLSLVALGSLAGSAECKPGYQPAQVARVLGVSTGATAPARAEEESPQPAQSARLVIFGAGGKQYALRLPPGSQEVSVAAGPGLLPQRGNDDPRAHWRRKVAAGRRPSSPRDASDPVERPPEREMAPERFPGTISA